MENISRLVLFFVFLYCTSESQSASILERRFPPPPAADMGLTEEMNNPGHPGAGVESGSAEVLLELSDDEKPQVQRTWNGIQDTTRQDNIKETAAILATFLDGHHDEKSRGGEWGQEAENYGEGQEWSSQGGQGKGGMWALLNRRYGQRVPQGMTTSHQRFLADKGYQQNSVKRSPACLKKCIAQGFLHPAQCHSLC